MTFYYVTFPKTKTNGYKTKMFCTGIRFENCMSGLSLTTRTPEKPEVFAKTKNKIIRDPDRVCFKKKKK